MLSVTDRINAFARRMLSAQPIDQPLIPTGLMSGCSAGDKDDVLAVRAPPRIDALTIEFAEIRHLCATETWYRMLDMPP
ncbi:hypothetical protein [Burkholderia sp. IMCC1007]|uniref:hypothetical protein n=1 Tax=Burkholderia sp. IMCC1007 TaxID=3004104 RepID=UPI002F960A66